MMRIANTEDEDEMMGQSRYVRCCGYEVHYME